MQEDADKIVVSLQHKKDELSRHEDDLVAYLKKLQLVTEKADAVLTPIVNQKQELEFLTKKLEEGLASLDGTVQQRVQPLLQELEAKIGETVAALRNDFQTGVSDVMKKLEELAKSLSGRVDAGEKASTALKSTLEETRRFLEQEKKDTAELKKTVQDLKNSVEKQKQEFKSELYKQGEEFKATSEKQKEELKSQLDKRRQEVDATLTELSEKHIKVLEKDDAQFKSTLNAIIAKLGNVKFKKLLGL